MLYLIVNFTTTNYLSTTSSSIAKYHSILIGMWCGREVRSEWVYLLCVVHVIFWWHLRMLLSPLRSAFEHYVLQIDEVFAYVLLFLCHFKLLSIWREMGRNIAFVFSTMSLFCWILTVQLYPLLSAFIIAYMSLIWRVRVIAHGEELLGAYFIAMHLSGLIQLQLSLARFLMLVVIDMLLIHLFLLLLLLLMLILISVYSFILFI